MKLFLFLFTFLLSIVSQAQDIEIINEQVTKISIKTKSDSIDFIIIDTTLTEKKPIFLWCQGSSPYTLFLELEDEKIFFFAGGLSNFNYRKIVENYHLVVIAMPKTPVVGLKENLNNQYEYVPDIERPREYSEEYLAANYLDNYVQRANCILKYLKKQKWVVKDQIVVAGHSQGTKVAAKIAIENRKVSHLGLFSPNPFGRIDQLVREPRLDAQLGLITWEEADSIINRQYDFFELANNTDSIAKYPQLRAWQSFSETFYDDWLELKIPIYITYGTEDRIADLCDIVPLFFIQEQKRNLTMIRRLHLDHNFFEIDETGVPNREKGHWHEAMSDFLEFLEFLEKNEDNI